MSPEQISYQYQLPIEPFQGKETTNPEEAANWINEKGIKIAAAEFGNVIALFCRNEQEAMDHMALLKGLAGGKADARGGKANTLTTALEHNSDIRALPGLAKGISEETLQIFANALAIGSREHPFGLLLPADIDGVASGIIPKRIIGEFTPQGKDKPAVPTVGIMVSGPHDASYSNMVRALDANSRFVAGSSGNASGDSSSRGSGHHFWKAFREQFNYPDICILYPQSIEEIFKRKEGGSTTMVYIDEHGIATISRVGSVKMEPTIIILTKAGVKEIRVLPEILRHAEPFDYSTTGKSEMELQAEDYLVWSGVRFQEQQQVLYPKTS